MELLILLLMLLLLPILLFKVFVGLIHFLWSYIGLLFIGLIGLLFYVVSL